MLLQFIAAAMAICVCGTACCLLCICMYIWIFLVRSFSVQAKFNGGNEHKIHSCRWLVLFTIHTFAWKAIKRRQTFYVYFNVFWLFQTLSLYACISICVCVTIIACMCKCIRSLSFSLTLLLALWWLTMMHKHSKRTILKI